MGKRDREEREGGRSEREGKEGEKGGREGWLGGEEKTSITVGATIVFECQITLI